MSFYLAPSMNLVIPGVLTEPGPDWANDINASLVIIDGHTHASGSGVAITPSAININADLSFNNTWNITNPRSVRLYPLASAPTSVTPDVGCIYVAGNELYYNDVSGGHQVQITTNGSVNAGSGSIGGLPSGTAAVNYVPAQGSYVFQRATSTAANLDMGSLIIRYPGSYPTPSGNYIELRAPSSLNSAYNLTLPALPGGGSTQMLTLGTTGIISSISYDAVGQNMTSVGANAIATTMAATGANIIGANMTATGSNPVIRSTTRALNSGSVGGVGLSASCGNFTATNVTSSTPITNLSTTIITSGRPVLVGFVSDASGGASLLQGQFLSIILLSGATEIYRTTISSGNIPPGGIFAIDTTVIGVSGSHAYSANYFTSAGAGITVAWIKLFAFEMT